jgi:hypothetical protein
MSLDAIHCYSCWNEEGDLIKVAEGEYSSPARYLCQPCFAREQTASLREEFRLRFDEIERRISALESKE